MDSVGKEEHTAHPFGQMRAAMLKAMKATSVGGSITRKIVASVKNNKSGQTK